MNVDERMREELLGDGFRIAVELMTRMDESFDVKGLMDRLAALANGEMTLYNSTDEEMADMVRISGKPLTPEQRAGMVAGFADRKKMDERDRSKAKMIQTYIFRGM